MTPAETTEAIVMRAYGPPEVLRLEQLRLAPLTVHDVRIAMIAAAVNHSDLEIRAGHWLIQDERPFPYVPGLEVVGTVAAVGTAVTRVRVGQCVTTMMMGLGGVRAERQGGYSRYVTVSEDVLAAVPSAIDPFDAAALGLGAVTAHQGLAQLGELANKRVLITGAAGGVGSNAVAIAAARGARVVALARGESSAAYLRNCGAHDVVSSADALGRGSVDAVLDLVGGPGFERVLAAIADGGRYSLVGAMGGDRVGFSLWELMRPLTLTGYSSESLDGDALRGALADVFALRVAGRLPVPAWAAVPLARAAEAHARLHAGGVRGRILLVPDET